jgi:hypothetical protein
VVVDERVVVNVSDVSNVGDVRVGDVHLIEVS